MDVDMLGVIATYYHYDRISVMYHSNGEYGSLVYARHVVETRCIQRTMPRPGSHGMMMHLHLVDAPILLPSLKLLYYQSYYHSSSTKNYCT